MDRRNVLNTNKLKTLTLNETKNEVAKKYGYESWWGINFYHTPSEEVLRDEVAELYSQSQNAAIQKHNESLIYTITRNEETINKLQEMVKYGLPERCVQDWGSVKFCTNRQGEGNICKQCLNF